MWSGARIGRRPIASGLGRTARAGFRMDQIADILRTRTGRQTCARSVDGGPIWARGRGRGVGDGRTISGDAGHRHLGARWRPRAAAGGRRRASPAQPVEYVRVMCQALDGPFVAVINRARVQGRGRKSVMARVVDARGRRDSITDTAQVHRRIWARKEDG